MQSARQSKIRLLSSWGLFQLNKLTQNAFENTALLQTTPVYEGLTAILIDVDLFKNRIFCLCDLMIQCANSWENIEVGWTLKHGRYNAHHRK